MDRSTLQKLILAKLPLPADFCEAMKAFFPLNPPTPTALLMKAVEVEYFGNEQHVSGEVLRRYQPDGEWSHPPCWPEILYTHVYILEPYPFPLFGISREWDVVTGELTGSEREVRIVWPVLEPGLAPAVTYWTPEQADAVEQSVRRWSTMPLMRWG